MMISLKTPGWKIVVMDKIKNKCWLLLDLTIICFLISLILLGGMNASDSHFGAAFFAAMGLFLLTSNKMKDKLYFSRAISWVAENVFKPKTRFNHIISGCLFIFIGIAILISEPLSSSEEEFFDNLKRTSEFWICIILVLLFNIFVGIYTARRRKQKNNVESGT